MADSKSAGLIPRVGSSPTSGTRNPSIYWGFELFGARKRCFDPSRLPSSNRGFQNFPSFISPMVTGVSGFSEVDSEVGRIRSVAVEP